MRNKKILVPLALVAAAIVAVVWWPRSPTDSPILADGPALLSTPQTRQDAAALRDRMDPAKSGWQSEAFAEAAAAPYREAP